jgi:hypothetical protein
MEVMDEPAEEIQASAPCARNDVGEPEEAETAPSAFDQWRRDSALGAIGTGVARGLQAVFAPPADEPVMVAEAPGEPPDAADRLRVILDPDDPAKSVAVVPAPRKPDLSQSS